MARRSPPGDREAIEAVLERAGLLAPLVTAAVTLFRVPRDKWQSVQALQLTFEQAAAEHRARELREAEGLADRTAIERAASELGLVPDTVRDRHEQWPRQAVVG